jgi:hypothetical protein
MMTRNLLGGSCLMVAVACGFLGAAFGQDTNFAAGPQYLVNGSPLFARSIATPSMPLSEPALAVGATNATGVLIDGADNQTSLPPSADALPQVDLFSIYYGKPSEGVVEISFSKAETEIPASISGLGVWQLTTAQNLINLGYGVTLGEAARYGVAQTRRATHLYTNADIDRLHAGG